MRSWRWSAAGNVLEDVSVTRLSEQVQYYHDAAFGADRACAMEKKSALS